MYIKQLYTSCLSQAAYYIESNGEAAIIDPLRDPAPYLEMAKSRGTAIRFIFETHFHADFVSGHLDLAKASGATIIFGPLADPGYTAHVANDRERIRLGNVEIEVLHTPGHTIESTCYLVYNSDGRMDSLFSGDTLFAGDVGRPDLMSGNLSAEILAGKLYDSLEQKIKTLPDSVFVYPGHGAGSACGKRMDKERITTIGQQRQTNYAMQAMSKEEFVQLVTEGQSAPPQYFFTDALLNKSGTEDFESVLAHGMSELSASDFDNMQRAGAVIIDTRSPKQFGAGHIPGSVNVGIDGDFAVWVGTLYPFTTKFLLVTDPGREKECVTRLARIGYDSIIGVLSGGLRGWMDSGKPVEQIRSVSPRDAEQLLTTGGYILLDVRRPAEVTACGIKDAVCIPLALFPTELRKLDASQKYVVCCAGGYRSMIACSLMRSMDIRHVVNLDGGANCLAKEQPGLLEAAV